MSWFRLRRYVALCKPRMSMLFYLFLMQRRKKKRKKDSLLYSLYFHSDEKKEGKVNC